MRANHQGQSVRESFRLEGGEASGERGAASAVRGMGAEPLPQPIPRAVLPPGWQQRGWSEWPGAGSFGWLYEGTLQDSRRKRRDLAGDSKGTGNRRKGSEGRAERRSRRCWGPLGCQEGVQQPWDREGPGQNLQQEGGDPAADQQDPGGRPSLAWAELGAGLLRYRRRSEEGASVESPDWLGFPAEGRVGRLLSCIQTARGHSSQFSKRG